MARNKSVVVVGMAGSGKTTLCRMLYTFLTRKSIAENNDDISKINQAVRNINLDPAVINCKTPAHLDIRDYINIPELMKKHNLGPNGALNTGLNLFFLNQINRESEVTIFDDTFEYSVYDTPGQLESFIWNSPGAFLFERLQASKENQVNVVYVIDINQNTLTRANVLYLFMTNLIFASMIQNRYPSIRLRIALNKSDLNNYGELLKYKENYDYFLQKLSEENIEYSSYIGSMATYFEEFYCDIETISISSLSGEGIEKLIETF